MQAQRLSLSRCAATIQPISHQWRDSHCLMLSLLCPLRWVFTFLMKNQALGGNTVGWIAGSKWQSWQGEGNGIFL